MQVCPSCGEENPPKFRLCGYCGAVLAPQLERQEERKTVTVFFSDLKGSTNLGEALDPEALREVMTRYFDSMTEVLRRHGGTIEKFIGDAIMAVFGLPKLHEDDALRAVRAAAETRSALAVLNDDLERRYGVRLTNRTGVNTGEVVAGDPTGGQRLVTGDAVNVAARLEQAAPPNEVLIGDLTYRLVRGSVQVEAMEPLELKGKSERVPAYRVIDVLDTAASERRGDAGFVGRAQELAVLEAQYAAAASARRCRTVTIVGDAGVGKTRLVREFVERHETTATVLQGRCLPYGEGITFWPLVELTRAAAGIEPEDTTEQAIGKIDALVSDPEITMRVTTAVGLADGQFPLAELFWGVRRLMQVLAADRPLIVVIDDIHWAESTFLDLLEHLTETLEAPVLLVCTARHELMESHGEWGTVDPYERLILEPLSDGESRHVVQNLLGATGIAADVRERIVLAAEGNPLFVEQLLSMLIDTRVLTEIDGRWESSGDISSISVPPTIHALLAARFDHLSREERAVIEPAAVVGVEFPVEAVVELAPEPVRPHVHSLLAATTRKQFVRPEPVAPGEDETYRFHHILVRDAAYQSLLKRARATLHERFVGWAERINAERGRGHEFDEIHGYHLEQAYRYLSELGPLDDHGLAIGQRAAERLAGAGRRAFARGDMPAAVNLLQRAATLAPDSLQRLAILPELGEALSEAGRFEDALAVLDDAQSLAVALGDPVREADAKLMHLMAQLYSGGAEWTTGSTREVERAMRVFDIAADHAGLAKAWRLMWAIHGTAQRYGESAIAAQRVLEEGRLASDRRLVARGAAGYAIGALFGPVPVPEVVSRCEELAAEIDGDRRTEALIRGVLAQLYAMLGETERARDMSAESLSMLEELGAGVLSSATSLNSSTVELLAGDLEAAERQLRRDYDALSQLGERFLLSSVAGSLGRVVYQRDRFEDAEALAMIVEGLAAADDVDAQALWRSVLGMCLARRGEIDDGVRLAAEAVELRRGTDALVLLAEALTDLAEALRFAGRDDEVRALRSEALELYERKGDIVSAGRLRVLLS
ncbi:MAG: adenylate/guanylate cyclase domain-containing protein [Chloroflexota bacterium]